MIQRISLYILIGIIFTMTNLLAEKSRLITKQFSNKQKVIVNLSSGDLELYPAKDHQIQLLVTTTYPANEYDILIKDNSDQLKLSEQIIREKAKGQSLWKLYVPQRRDCEVQIRISSGDIKVLGLANPLVLTGGSSDISLTNCTGEAQLLTASADIKIRDHSGNLRLKSASGDLKIKKMTGNLEFKTSSGDIDIENVTGQITMKASSGDMKLSRTKGSLNLHSASGEIRINNSKILEQSNLKSASGDIVVSISNPLKSHLSLSSGSGSLLVDFNGLVISGSLQLKTSKSNIDDISLPFKWSDDQIKIVTEWGRQMAELNIEIDGKKPLIQLSSISGRIQIKK